MSRSRSVATAGWPVLAGLAAFVLGLLMLGATAFFHRQAQRLVESAAQAPAGQQAPTNANPAASEVEAFASRLPAFKTHLDDVSLLFNLARDQGVSIGPIAYRSEANPALPVVVRQAELRMDEEYPKLKAFVAALLRKMPHLYLEEIRIEQGTATTKVQATLKLSFAYRGGKGTSQ